MLINQRVIWKNNTSLVDISVETNDLFTGTKVIDFVASQDAIYIGSDLPFNHRYFQLGAVNSLASAATVQIWDGSTWNNAVDVIDQTSLAGASMGQSGILSWTTDDTKSWAREESSEDITDLSTLKIYNLYWVKITWSADWTATTSFAYVGHKFSNDNMLAAVYPDLGRSAVKTAHTTGKTNWNDQHVLASEAIIAQLRKERVLSSPAQIFSWEMFQMAQTHKVAEMIFASFGEAKTDERQYAKDQYDLEMNQIVFDNQDKDGDGHLDESERFGSIEWRRV